MAEKSLRPVEILARLNEEGVAFVLIGGVAAAAHGSPYPTGDLDICPWDDDENLRRLAKALESLDAKLMVGIQPPISIVLNPRILRSTDFLNFVTRLGRVDIVWRPAGTFGYEDLHRQSVRVRIGDVDVEIASMGDIIRSKSALLRDKDLKTLHVLRELEERRIQETKRDNGRE